MDHFAEFERDGFTIKARTEYDDDASPPWKRSEGHGEVSEWTDRKKGPGERVLVSDRRSFCYSDVTESMRRAKRDGWDAPPYGTGTKGQRAARAVEADF